MEFAGMAKAWNSTLLQEPVCGELSSFLAAARSCRGSCKSNKGARMIADWLRSFAILLLPCATAMAGRGWETIEWRT